MSPLGTWNHLFIYYAMSTPLQSLFKKIKSGISFTTFTWYIFYMKIGKNLHFKNNNTLVSHPHSSNPFLPCCIPVVYVSSFASDFLKQSQSHCIPPFLGFAESWGLLSFFPAVDPLLLNLPTYFLTQKSLPNHLINRMKRLPAPALILNFRSLIKQNSPCCSSPCWN